MDGTFVDRLRAGFQSPFTIAQRVFTPKDWQEVERRIPVVESLKVGTLTGLVDYLKRNADIPVAAGLLVHVKDPATVEVRGPLDTEDVNFRRQTYLTASTALVGGSSLKFGEFLDAETFFIGLQSGFAPNAGRDDILMLVASIKESDVRHTLDYSV